MLVEDMIQIDNDLRTITVPSNIKLLGVESDDSVNRLWFSMPKTYGGFDLSTFAVRINYMNANNEGDVYVVDDVVADDNGLVFTWLVGRHACEYKGNVKFIVCLKKTDENDVVIQEFNTTVKTLPVLEGLETTEAIIQENPDIFEQLLRQIVPAVNTWLNAHPEATNGQPEPVTLVSQMTETSGIYLYLGSETGYDYGYIYVHLNGVLTKTNLYGKGQNGENGNSPTATVTQISTGARISVTDKNGTTTASVENGTATDAQVAAWLDNHPEATTTVVDGAITTDKLADGAVTENKLDPNLELGVKNNAVTTDKLADHAVTMEKTDFFYAKQLSKEYTWVSKTYSSSSGHRLPFKWSLMDTILNEFPETLSVVMEVSADYWASGGTTITLKTSGNHTATLPKHSKNLTVNGQMYGVLYFLRSEFDTAYESLLEYINNGETWSNVNPQINNTGTSKIPADSNTWFIADVVTTDMIEAHFTENVMSEDFATAVKRAIESDEGTSADEEVAKNRLSGKAMICLGDSYTVGMGGLLSSLANKYEMAIDNRGIVSSTISGTWSASTGTGTGYQPMWRRANSIISDYTSGYVINETTYQASDVGVVVFMGGANDGFGVDTWIGTGIHETDTSKIYGACNHIFNVLAKTFTNAKLICITQPSSYNREVSSITDDATAQALGFENLAELQQMDNIQFSNYAMAQKEKAVKDTAWTYGWSIVDMFHDFPTMFSASNRSAYWQSDKLHLTSSGYSLITQALDKKIVELVVG